MQHDPTLTILYSFPIVHLSCPTQIEEAKGKVAQYDVKDEIIHYRGVQCEVNKQRRRPCIINKYYRLLSADPPVSQCLFNFRFQHRFQVRRDLVFSFKCYYAQYTFD